MNQTYDEVVVACGGGPDEAGLMSVARQLADQLRAPLRLLHAVDGQRPYTDVEPLIAEHARTTSIDTVDVRPGVAAERILELIDHPRTIGCIGSGGRGAVARVWFRSVSRDVLRNATHPVVVVGPEVSAVTDVPFEASPLLLGAADEGHHGAELAAHARRWADELGAELHVVRVEPAQSEGRRRGAEVSPGAQRPGNPADRLASAVGSVGVDSGWEVVPGDDVGDTLATLAGDVGAPLLIVGTEAGPGLADRLRPSVASTAVRSSPCPVLVVPLRD